jgi:hypothetical protein
MRSGTAVGRKRAGGEGGGGEKRQTRERERERERKEVCLMLGPAHLADRVAVHSQADSKKKLSQKKN